MRILLKGRLVRGSRRPFNRMRGVSPLGVGAKPSSGFMGGFFY